MSMLVCSCRAGGRFVGIQRRRFQHNLGIGWGQKPLVIVGRSFVGLRARVACDRLLRAGAYGGGRGVCGVGWGVAARVRVPTRGCQSFPSGSNLVLRGALVVAGVSLIAALSCMSSDSVQVLAARKAELDATLAETRKELRRERQLAKDARRRVWVLSQWLTNVVLILYSFAGHTPIVARLFLARAALSRGWPAKGDEELDTIVEDKFLGADVEHLAGLSDLDAPADPSAMKVARRYFEEWRLVEWVGQLNQGKGVAPSTDLVLTRYEGARSQLPAVCRPGHAGTAASTKGRSWAFRWRRRWGGRHGALRAREDITAAEIRDKVITKRGLVGIDYGPNFVPRIWSCFGGQPWCFGDRLAESVFMVLLKIIIRFGTPCPPSVPTRWSSFRDRLVVLERGPFLDSIS